MANLAAMRTALQRLGFSDDASRFITEQQGLDALTEFRILKDEEVESLCKVVRRPGGTIPNPAAQQQEGQPATLPNPGIAVSLRAENNLKLACYYLRYKERTSRTVTPDDITLDRVRAYRDHKEWEENHEDVKPPEINARNWPRTIEAIEEYLRGCLGVTGIPLAYIVREQVTVPAGDDPQTNYTSKQDELIARAPHKIDKAQDAFTPTYMTDRARVWELISELCRDQDCWSYVRPAQRTRDGRLAFTGLKGHYLGVNNVDNMSTRAERKLTSTTYTGEKRRWNFEKYVKVHIDQHAILEGLVEHGYAGIDARSKVRFLCNGIKVTSLDTVKTQIMSDEKLRSDFNACVNLFQDFIEQSGAGQSRDVLIAAVNTDQEELEAKADMTVEDRYYNKTEYAKLTSAQKLGLKLKREKRGHKKKRKSRSNGKTDKLELSDKSINSLVAAMQSATTDDGDDMEKDDESDDESEEERPKKKVKFAKQTSNRTNSALKRSGKK